jgi:hypothetical protein
MTDFMILVSGAWCMLSTIHVFQIVILDPIHSWIHALYEAFKTGKWISKVQISASGASNHMDEVHNSDF